MTATLNLTEAITADMIDRLPIMGGAFVLITIIGIVTRLWLGSEARHRAELERIGAAHVAELERIGATHVAEITVLKAEITGLRVEVRKVHAELDEERRLRWRAQDVAAQRRRQQEHRGERGDREHGTGHGSG